MATDNKRKSTLGRGLSDLGLSELLGDATAPAVATVAEQPAAVTAPVTQEQPSAAGMRVLAIDQLRPGRYQPRQQFHQEDLQQLADSIKSQGIIQPIVVRRSGDQYEIIAGERRWRAAQLVNLTDVPVIIRDVSDEAALAMALIENVQRRDLNVIEEAQAMQRLIEEFALTHQEVAEAVGKSRTMVTNLLRLLKLNSEVRAMVENNELEMGHARALLSLDEAQQLAVASKVVQQKLSVRETEKLIRQYHEAPQALNASVSTKDPNIKQLERTISDKLGAAVFIRHQQSGKGKVVVQYNSLDELDGMLQLLAIEH